MTNESLTDVVARLIDALDDGQGKGIGPSGVPLHLPPMDGRPMGTPAIIIQIPELLDYVGTVGGCPHYDFRADVMVVGSDTTGVDLVGLVDAVIATLHQANYRVTSGNETGYQPPDSPSPLPAYQLTVE